MCVKTEKQVFNANKRILQNCSLSLTLFFFIYDWTVGTNVRWLIAVKLWPNVDRFTALEKRISVHDSCNGLVISLNSAIYPKFLLLKDFLSAAIEIKNCSGISKPRRTNSLFSVLFFNGGMLVFSTATILWWPWIIVVFPVIRWLSTFWKWQY